MPGVLPEALKEVQAGTLNSTAAVISVSRMRCRPHTDLKKISN